jgi:iron(III) transport system permease protein
MADLVADAPSRRPALRLRFSLDTAVMVAAVLILLYLIGVPLIMNVLTAFRGPIDFLPFENNAKFTFDNIPAAYGTSRTWTTFWDTGLFAIGAVSLGFAVGGALAWLVERTDIPFRNVIFVMAIIPIMMPPINSALAWIFMLGKTNGFINVVIRSVFRMEGSGPFDIFTLYGMIIVQGLGVSTLIFLLVGAALRNMDSSLEEASAASGASQLTTFRRVTLPLLLPIILSVLILAFIFAIESFEVPLVIGLGARRQVFAGTVYFALNPAAGLPRYGEVAAFSLSFLTITYVLFYYYSRLTKRASRFATVTGKGFRPRRQQLGRWKYPALAGIIVFGLFQIVFPLSILLWTSLLGRFAAPSISALGDLSLDSYRSIFADDRFGLALRNTFVVAFGSALLVSFVSIIVAWIVVRRNVRGKRLLDLIASSSVAIPGVVAGLSFVIFYLTISRWIPIWGTIWVLVLAYSYRLSLAYRVHVAGLTQIGGELEEASAASGASFLSTFKRIIVPLMAPNLMVVFLLIFFLAFRDFTLALLLSGRDSMVLSVLMWNRLSESEFGEAAAISVVIMVALFTMAAVMRGLVLKRFRNF